MKLVRYFGAVAVLIYFLSFPADYRRWTHPFHPNRVAVERAYNPEWEVEPTAEQEEQIVQILSQPFTYLGKGIQSFAFGSQDGQYVLKLFRFDPCKAPYGQSLIRWCKNRIGIHPRAVLPLEERMAKTFHACLLSYKYLQDETAVVWVNLNPKKRDWPSIQVRDRMHRWHTLDTNQYRFVLQKRAVMLKPALYDAYKNDQAKFCRMIHSFTQLLLSLDKKGMASFDPKMPSNFGFIGEQAIQIDFGNLTDQPIHGLHRSKHFASRLRGFLVKYMPQGVAVLDEGMKDAE